MNLLFIADIDNTLVSAAGGAAALRAWLLHRPEIIFCVATGRRLETALPLLHAAGLPPPAACICAVGTRIHYRSAWKRERFKPCRAWSRATAQGWNAGAVRRLLKAEPELEPQPASEQNSHKLSYFTQDAPSMAAAINARLSAAGLGAHVVASHQHLLDVLAPRAGKAAAAEFVRRAMGIPRPSTIVAGDSGNDLDMLTAGHHAIIVANHEPVLARLRAKPGAYFSARPGALGVLEGLHHHRPTRSLSSLHASVRHPLPHKRGQAVFNLTP